MHILEMSLHLIQLIGQMLTKKPLVILVEVNHHMQTTIFGCALLVDETVKTYIWVLKTLIGAMNNKMPMSVVTDGDKAP
jgi:hypothetical protein